MRSINIWKFKEEFILSKSYKYDDSYRKEGTMLQKRGKNENQTGQPKKRKGNCSRRKAEKQDNSYSEPMVEKENYSLYQSIHKIEREYLQEMDEMVMCEENNTFFDRTKLDRLTKLLEKLNEEDENFETAGTKQMQNKTM